MKFKSGYKVLRIYGLTHLLTRFGKGRRTEVRWFSLVRVSRGYLQRIFTTFMIPWNALSNYLKKKKSFSVNLAAGARILAVILRDFFRAVSSGIAIVRRIDKSAPRYLVSADIDEPVRKIKNTPMLAKQMVSVPEVTGVAVHDAACIFGVRRVLARRIRTLITQCMRRCV